MGPWGAVPAWAALGGPGPSCAPLCLTPFGPHLFTGATHKSSTFFSPRTALWTSEGGFCLESHLPVREKGLP